MNINKKDYIYLLNSGTPFTNIRHQQVKLAVETLPIPTRTGFSLKVSDMIPKCHMERFEIELFVVLEVWLFSHWFC